VRIADDVSLRWGHLIAEPGGLLNRLEFILNCVDFPALFGFKTGARVRMSSVILPDPELAVKPALSDEEKQARLTAEIEKSEKLAASQLHMAEWFLSQGKNDIAKRRLQLLIETLPRSEASDTARKLLEGL
jgi:hypothetical protein